MIAFGPHKDSSRTERTRRRFLTVFATALMLGSGCAHAPEVDTVVYEAPKGSVYLERIPDRSVKAAHPIAIEEAVIARALGGVMISERKTTFQTVFSKQPAAARAFSDEDVRFLTPFVTAALRQAAADQQVGFHVRNYPSGLSFSSKSGAGVGSSDPPLANSTLLETTSGHLLARDQWLYLTMTQYRKRAEQADTINMANRRLPDPTGEADKEFVFEPKDALKANGKAGLFGNSSDAVFVIDYKRLAQLPALETPIPASEKPLPPLPAGRPNGKDEDIKEIKQEMKKKDVEIENLKREMEDIRRDLGKPSPKAP